MHAHVRVVVFFPQTTPRSLEKVFCGKVHVVAIGRGTSGQTSLLKSDTTMTAVIVLQPEWIFNDQ